MPKLGRFRDATGAGTLGADARSFTRFNRSGPFPETPVLATPAFRRAADLGTLAEGALVTVGYLRAFALRFAGRFRFAGARRAEAFRFAAFFRFAGAFLRADFRFAVFRFADFFLADFFFADFLFAGFFMLSLLLRGFPQHMR
jgi:hypothetical protein